MNFDIAFEKLIGHEGGYVNDPKDRGGETNFGISKKAYPGEDILNMTLERAKLLYRRDYWGPAGCDLVPDSVKFHVFDMAVNSGVVAAIKNIQRTVGVPVDGVFGPQTLQAISYMPPLKFNNWFNAERLIGMTEMSSWPAHGKGWVRRVAKNLKEE